MFLYLFLSFLRHQELCGPFLSPPSFWAAVQYPRVKKKNALPGRAVKKIKYQKRNQLGLFFFSTSKYFHFSLFFPVIQSCCFFLSLFLVASIASAFLSSSRYLFSYFRFSFLFLPVTQSVLFYLFLFLVAPVIQSCRFFFSLFIVASRALAFLFSSR